jgi:hypothetical protein
MDAGVIDLAAAWRPAADRFRVRLSLWISGLLVAAMAVATALILARRLAGGLEQPLSSVAIGSATAIAAILAAAARFTMPTNFSASRAAVAWLRWSTAVLLVVFVAALWLPGTSWFAIAIAWGIVAVEELLSWRRFHDRTRRSTMVVAPRSVSSLIAKPDEVGLQLAITGIVPASAVATAAAPLLPPASPATSAEVIQQSTRSHTAGGVDRLAGWLQMALAAGERNATAHIAFCPPFLETPKISLRQTAGPAGRIRAMQILPHGVRLELKLDHSPRQPQRVAVEFIAESRSG